MIGNIVSGILCTFFFFFLPISRWKLAEPTQFQGEKNVSFFISFYRKIKLHTNRQKAILLFVLKAHAPPPPPRCYNKQQNKQQTILMLFIKLLYFLWLLTDTHFSSELLKVTQHWKSPRDKETTILSLRLSRRELNWYKKGIVYTCIRWLLHTIVKLLKHNKKSDTKKKNSSKIKELTKKKN